MAPVWQQTYERGIRPYIDGETGMEEAFTQGVEPIRRFMAHQIQRTENDDDVYLFLRYLPDSVDPQTGDLLHNYAYYEPQKEEKNQKAKLETTANECAHPMLRPGDCNAKVQCEYR